MSQFFTSTEQYKQFISAWSSAVNSDNAKKKRVPCDEWRYDIKKGSVIEGWNPVGPTSQSYVRKGTGIEVIKGWIKSEHHLLYNILRGKPLHIGFTPITNPNKLNPYISNMNTFYLTIHALINRVEWAQAVIADEKAVEKLREEQPFLTMIDKLKTYIKQAGGSDDLLDENTGFYALVEKLRGHLKTKPKGLLSASSKKFKTGRLESFLKPFNGTVTVEMLAEVDLEQLKMIQMFDRHHKQNYWLKMV